MRPSAAEAAGLLRALLQPKAAVSLGAKLLAGVGVAGLGAAVLFSLFANPEYAVDFQVTPAGASLYVDGQRLDGTLANVEPGLHQVLVVDQDHFGQVIALDAQGDAEMPVTLEPIGEPTFEQFEQFNSLFQNEVALDDLAGVDMPYLPYQQLLKLKEHQLRGETSKIDAMVGDLNALAKVGDPAAQLMLFVANFDQVITGDRFSGLIQQASNSGYGLATFYQALHYRWARERDDQLDIGSLQVYRSLMALALEQGLEFAAQFVEQADSVLQSL